VNVSARLVSFDADRPARRVTPAYAANAPAQMDVRAATRTCTDTRLLRALPATSPTTGKYCASVGNINIERRDKSMATTMNAPLRDAGARNGTSAAPHKRAMTRL